MVGVNRLLETTGLCEPVTDCDTVRDPVPEEQTLPLTERVANHVVTAGDPDTVRVTEVVSVPQVVTLCVA
jgi:hypothetical protein